MDDTKRILLVDDEQNITRSIKRLCRSKGYQVLIANSAAEALEVLAKEEIEVVLSDQLMPGMTGAELFEQIQQTYPGVVRILLTGYTALEGITKAVNQGAVYKVLFKPWDDEHLLSTLDEAFEYFEVKDKNKRLSEELLELNKDLERRVERKTLELSMHVKRLQVSQKLFELLPDAAMGISEEGLIVEANKQALNLFASEGLVGLKATMVLPDALKELLSTCQAGEPNTPQTTHAELNGKKISFQCIKTDMGLASYGYLMFGRVPDE